MSSLQLQGLWQYIQTMSLSDRNKQWLAARLLESTKQAQKSGIELGLEDIKSGNVYKAENSADLVKLCFYTPLA